MASLPQALCNEVWAHTEAKRGYRGSGETLTGLDDRKPKRKLNLKLDICERSAVKTYFATGNP